MNVAEHIEQNYGGSQSKFAHAIGASKQAVNFWIRKGYIVVDGVLYSPRKRPEKSILVDGTVYVPQREVT